MPFVNIDGPSPHYIDQGEGFPFAGDRVSDHFIKQLNHLLAEDVFHETLHRSGTTGFRLEHSSRSPSPFSSTQNRLPLPGADSTPILPSMRLTTLFASARPRPVPGYFSEPRWKMWNSRGRNSSAIPIPLSWNHSRTDSPRGST